MTDDGFSSHYVTASDGLRLHVREYGDRSFPLVPVVCLPGLTRTAADFHPLACALAHDPVRPHRVLAVDYRGRGLSGYDPDPARYTIPIELGDLLTALDALAVGPAVMVGTSRGGLITMVLATMRPDAIAGAVLNDIGPVVETAGLMRIKSYVGRAAMPKDFATGAAALKAQFGEQFPDLSDEDWLAFAHRSWRVENGALVPTYDQALARTLDTFDPTHPMPTLWDGFDALAAVPVMVIRGGMSDILSAETVAAMKARRQDLAVLEVPRQGHAPMLAEDDVIEKIAAFVGRCNARAG